MKKVIITLLCIAILGGGGYAGAMKYKKNQDKKTVVAVVPVTSLPCLVLSIYASNC